MTVMVPASFTTSLPVVWSMVVAPVSALTLQENSMEYTGTELKPTVTVTDKGKVIPAGEYTVAYNYCHHRACLPPSRPR